MPLGSVPVRVTRSNQFRVCRKSDALALHISRHSGDDVVPDDIERLLIALQRAGHLTSRDVMRLQASYLRETKP